MGTELIFFADKTLSPLIPHDKISLKIRFEPLFLTDDLERGDFLVQ